MNTTSFYIVISTKRGASPRPSRHEDLDEATREARRLAVSNPDDEFTIFHAVRRVQVHSVQITDLSDIPF